MSAHRILVVDDNPANLRLAACVLEFEGHQVWRASSAEEAQQLLRQNRPDLILMDIQMPGMDGLTLTRRLKADAATRDITIVAVTSFAMKGDDLKADEAGCDGYIPKPVDTRQLPAQVLGFLQRHRADRPSEGKP